MSGKNDFYIVTTLPVEEHATLGDAEALRDALARHFPDKTFRVFRCKRHMHSARHFPKLVELLRDVLNARGLSPDLAARARVILTTIGTRNDGKLPINDSVPEFDKRETRRS
jgi:hypothetical protein